MFRPMKAPNEPLSGETIDEKLCGVPFPVIASYKLDGIRMIVHSGHLMTSSGKDFANVNVRRFMEPLTEYCCENNLMFDGELLSHSTPFNDFSGIVRSHNSPLPLDTKFYCFDMVYDECYSMPFGVRIEGMKNHLPQFPFCSILPQLLCTTHQQVIDLYGAAISWGCDGVMLRKPTGRYKQGRATLNEGLIWKLKPYESWDACIVRVNQGTDVSPDALKTVNELGYSKTSMKQEDRVPANRAATFTVIHNGEELDVTIKATLPEKIAIWQHREEFIGRYIEYKGLVVGSKNLPRHPVLTRMRPDLDTGTIQGGTTNGLSDNRGEESHSGTTIIQKEARVGEQGGVPREAKEYGQAERIEL